MYSNIYLCTRTNTNIYIYSTNTPDPVLGVKFLRLLSKWYEYQSLQSINEAWSPLGHGVVDFAAGEFKTDFYGDYRENILEDTPMRSNYHTTNTDARTMYSKIIFSFFTGNPNAVRKGQNWEKIWLLTHFCPGIKGLLKIDPTVKDYADFLAPFWAGTATIYQQQNLPSIIH